jgi:hypothetical protein
LKETARPFSIPVTINFTLSSSFQDAHVPKTLMFLAAPLIAAGRKGKERAGQLKVVGRRGDRLDRRAKPHRRKARYSALR